MSKNSRKSELLNTKDYHDYHGAYHESDYHDAYHAYHDDYPNYRDD